jgi:hypothetical protein
LPQEQTAAFTRCVLTVFKCRKNALIREIGGPTTVRISTVTHCFQDINHSNAGLYTVIYTDKLIFREMDDQTFTLGLGIDVGIDEEWLASFGT